MIKLKFSQSRERLDKHLWHRGYHTQLSCHRRDRNIHCCEVAEGEAASRVEWPRLSAGANWRRVPTTTAVVCLRVCVRPPGRNAGTSGWFRWTGGKNSTGSKQESDAANDIRTHWHPTKFMSDFFISKIAVSCMTWYMRCTCAKKVVHPWQRATPFGETTCQDLIYMLQSELLGIWI